MSPAKRITKRQLKDDKFVDAIFHYGDVLKEHQRTIVGGLAIVIVLILGVTWTLRYREASQTQAQQAFSAALSELETAVSSGDEDQMTASLETFRALADEHSGSKVGKWALYYEAYLLTQTQAYLEAEPAYERYLEADPGGEFAIPARLGLSEVNGGMGRVKVQADMLRELAALEAVNEELATQWRYKAGEIYMDAGYFDEAREVFQSLLTEAEPPLRTRLEQNLDALAAL